MTHHLVCLTVDTDPDGSCGKTVDRNARGWRSLDLALGLPEALGIALRSAPIPMTWFVRADGQLRRWFGGSAYLLHAYGDLWDRVVRQGSELAWHPHLYKAEPRTGETVLIDDACEACDELCGIWGELGEASFAPVSFRNGEAWQSKEILATIEALGIRNDSSAVPGRRGGNGHPMDWMGTPTTPYFPDREDIRRPGPFRPILEMPMSTWTLRAPWDSEAVTRYINPAVHEVLFVDALERLRRAQTGEPGGLRVWVLVMHPEEVAPATQRDGLISHSVDAVLANVRRLCESFERAQETWTFSTLRDAAARWREAQGVPA